MILFSRISKRSCNTQNLWQLFSSTISQRLECEPKLTYSIFEFESFFIVVCFHIIIWCRHRANDRCMSVSHCPTLIHCTKYLLICRFCHVLSHTHAHQHSAPNRVGHKSRINLYVHIFSHTKRPNISRPIHASGNVHYYYYYITLS